MPGLSTNLTTWIEHPGFLTLGTVNGSVVKEAQNGGLSSHKIFSLDRLVARRLVVHIGRIGVRRVWCVVDL